MQIQNLQSEKKLKEKKPLWNLKQQKEKSRLKKEEENKILRLKIKNKKKISRLKKILRRKHSWVLFTVFNRIKKYFSKKIILQITFNNIFCTLIDLKKNKTLHIGSGGKYKIKKSKKNLRFNSKYILSTFLKRAKVHFKREELLVVLIGPTRIKKILIKQLKYFFKKSKKEKKKLSLTIEVKPKKCFNGCRPPKKVRKKRRRIRLLKKI